jgi:hypothetical protein
VRTQAGIVSSLSTVVMLANPRAFLSPCAAMRHNPRVMVKPDQLACPMMGRTAGFHTDKTLGQLGEEGQYVLAPERLGDDHAPRSVNAMNLKNMLGQIEANGRDRRKAPQWRRRQRGTISDGANGPYLGMATVTLHSERKSTPFCDENRSAFAVSRLISGVLFPGG